MREAIFIVVILLLLFGLTAYRYRRQIKFALEIWRTMKGVREIQSKARHSDPINPPAATGELVNCGRCGKWTPLSSAIKFGPTIYYCSTNCLQTKAKS